MVQASVASEHPGPGLRIIALGWCRQRMEEEDLSNGILSDADSLID